MSTIAANMLRSLLSPQAPAAGTASASAGVGGVNFAGLLDAAKRGTVTSSRPVEASAGAASKLTPDQLNRIAVAADRAESAGMSSALVLIDGQAVKLDVLSREVSEVMDPRAVAVTGVDGVLAAPGSSLSEQLSGQPSLDAAGAVEQQLLLRLGLSNAGRLSRPNASLMPSR